MNRDVNGESDLKSKQQQTPSSSYLVYLLLLSAGLILLLPYLFPSASLLSRTGSGTEETESVPKSRAGRYRPKATPAAYKPIDYWPSQDLRRYEGKCDSLEVLVMDLQRIVQAERERMMHLENEIRVMQISESFLKERVQYLEDRNRDHRREGFSPPYSTDSLLRNAQFAASDGRGGSGGVPDTLVHDLLRMVQVERERTFDLQSEIRILQKSEMSLQSRVERLEEQFAASCKESPSPPKGYTKG